VNQPRNFLKTRRVENREFGFRGDPGWHGSILAENGRSQMSVAGRQSKL
jgi:hypothetical protein